MLVSHKAELALIVASIVMFVVTLAAVPVIVVRLSADHFVRPPSRRSVFVHVARNVLGTLLVALGVAMLVLPGQGVLTILLGVSALDLPIKHRIIRRLLCLSKVRHAVQSLRHRAGKPPLQIPSASHASHAGDAPEPSNPDAPAGSGRSVSSRKSRAPSGSAGPSHA